MGADLSGYKALPTSRNALNWQPKIEQVVQQNGTGVDPLLVAAVIDVESSGNYKAKSPKNAQGLMQLIPATAERFGVKDPWNPDENINGGTQYLKFLLDRFNGDLSLALAGYNAGEGAVEKHGGIPPYPETQAYVSKVLGKYAALKQGAGGGAQPQAATDPQQVAAAPTVAPPQLDNPRAKFFAEQYAQRYQNPPVDKATQQKAVSEYLKQLNKINQDPELSDDVRTRMVQQLDATMEPYLPPNFLKAKGAKGTQAEGPSDKLKGFVNPEQAKAVEQDKAEELTLEQRAEREDKKYQEGLNQSKRNPEQMRGAKERAAQDNALRQRLGKMWQEREQLRNNPEKRDQALADLARMDKIMPADRNVILQVYQYLKGQGDWQKYRPQEAKPAIPLLDIWNMQGG